MVADLSGSVVMGIEWSLLTIATCLVALRLVVRLRIQRRSLVLPDAFLIISVIDAVGLIVCDTMSYRLGAMSGNSFAAEDQGAAALAQEVTLSKYSFASNYFFDSGMYFPKFSILAFYFNLFPVTMPWLRISLYLVTTYTVCAFVCTVFLDTFWCGKNVASNWSTDPEACSTFNSLVVFEIDWATEIASDLMIFILPFPLLAKLHLRPLQKWGLTLTFGLGLVTMAVSIARFENVRASDLYNTLYVWSMAELAVAIIVVALPALSSLLYPKSSRSQYVSSKKTGGQGSHHKLESAVTEDSGHGPGQFDNSSDVKLNVIYKSEEVDVESHSIKLDESGEWSGGPEPKQKMGYSVEACCVVQKGVPGEHHS